MIQVRMIEERLEKAQAIAHTLERLLAVMKGDAKPLDSERMLLALATAYHPRDFDYGDAQQCLNWGASLFRMWTNRLVREGKLIRTIEGGGRGNCSRFRLFS